MKGPRRARARLCTACFKWRDWRTPPARVVQRAFILFLFSLSHGSWERDIGRRPGGGSAQLSRSPCLNLISESPDPDPGRRQLGTSVTSHWTPARLHGPVQQLSSSQLDVRVAKPGVRPGAAAAGNEIQDASLAPARISFGPTRMRGAGTRSRGPGNGPVSHPSLPSLPAPPTARRTVSVELMTVGILCQAYEFELCTMQCLVWPVRERKWID